MKRYTIKPLEWVLFNPRQTMETAETGTYTRYGVWKSQDGRWVWTATTQGCMHETEMADTIDEAKAAAQAHWESRITQALQEVE